MAARQQKIYGDTPAQVSLANWIHHAGVEGTFSYENKKNC